MQEFKYTKYTVIMSVSITIFLLASGIFSLIIAKFTNGMYRGILLILSILLCLFAAKYEGLSHRNSKIIIDDEKIRLFRKQAGIITDTKLRYDEICSVKVIEKKGFTSLFIKKIILATEMQKMIIDINRYQDYKRLLQFIIHKVDKNSNISIDSQVMEWIKIN